MPIGLVILVGMLCALAGMYYGYKCTITTIKEEYPVAYHVMHEQALAWAREKVDEKKGA